MQTFLNLLGWLFRKTAYDTGLVTDPRTQVDKNRDYAHEERTAAPIVTDPFGNSQIIDSPYFYENQNNTSSCVAHGVGLALAIERKADLGTYTRIAQMFPYRLRDNYPAQGCWPQGVFDTYRKYGAPLFTTLPTPRTEEEANAMTLTTAMYNEAAIYKGLEYYTIKNCTDINDLAAVAQNGHGIAITIYATIEEWSQDYPIIANPSLSFATAPVRHCICVLPKSGFTLNGTKYVTIQDSAHFGNKVLRHLSESFIKARVYNAGYWDKVVALGAGQRPKYQFTHPLKYGMSGDEVKQMQLLFISEGLLPTGMASGYFGGRTLAALHAFQNKYAADILIPLQLTAPTDAWGYQCIQVANRLCQ